MKKVMSILLAGVMAASLFVPASAAAETINVHDAVERGNVSCPFPPSERSRSCCKSAGELLPLQRSRQNPNCRRSQ